MSELERSGAADGGARPPEPEFERTMGCTPEDLIGWLPVALPSASLETDAPAGRCVATFVNGSLTLTWEVLAALRIGLLEIPQLRVRFQYRGMAHAERTRVQHRFDRATQRGGG